MRWCVNALGEPTLGEYALGEPTLDEPTLGEHAPGEHGGYACMPWCVCPSGGYKHLVVAHEMSRRLRRQMSPARGQVPPPHTPCRPHVISLMVVVCITLSFPQHTGGTPIAAGISKAAHGVYPSPQRGPVCLGLLHIGARRRRRKVGAVVGEGAHIMQGGYVEGVLGQVRGSWIQRPRSEEVGYIYRYILYIDMYRYI